MELDELLEAEGLEIIGQPYPSRKNHVVRARKNEQEFILKIYEGEFVKNLELEYDMLMECSKRDIRAPIPIRKSREFIIMEYIDGENVSVLFDRYYERIADTDSGLHIDDLCDKLAGWLVQFHRKFDWKIARGDCILRNFLISNGKVVGLDFEECRDADPLSDLGDLCAFILSMRPEFTRERFEIAGRLSRSYGNLSGKDPGGEVSKMTARSLRHYAQFRKDRALLEDWASRIEQNGLHH
jgi:aminoglycoside phosphotransferase (APT) family kinase protein